MAALALLLHQLSIAIQLHAAFPAVDPGTALEHARAAVAAETPRVSAELLLAVAFVESRYDVTATSRVEGTRRRTGHYPSSAPPANLAPRASLYCGPLQTYAGSWRDCLALRDPGAAYAAGAAELEQWLHDRRVRGDVALALAGHGCGNAGIATGRCNAYPQRVLAIARRFEVTPRSSPRRAGA